jgi:hypothetical protein
VVHLAIQCLLTRSVPATVNLWVWICAYLNCVGWLLSALGELNPAGYAVALLAGIAALWVWQKRNSENFPRRARWAKLRRRFRRPFPLAFLILAAMAFLGGAIYPPSNYDALAYRLPRVLHWLAENHWHWIHTIFQRVNTRGCGIEWVSAPVIALMKTDRPLFLINIISFLLLPGLMFSVFTRLGVRRHVAWHWMWLAPTGYGFLLQAGSLGNDLFAAPFALAAVDFALRAKTTKSARDFFASILAAALMTGAKASGLPLLLPWALAILPSARLGLRWPARTAAIGLIASAASFLPTAILNAHHCGDWTGTAADRPRMVRAPVFKIGVNSGLVLIQSFVPPVFPLADQWNRMMDEKLPPHLIARLDRTMEGTQCRFHLDQMQIEENGGLGFGLSCLLLVSLVAVCLARSSNSVDYSPWLACVRWSPVISFLVLLSQSDLYDIPRVLTPYYGLLLAPLLACAGHERLMKLFWWRVAAFAVFLIAAGVLIVGPARPLFPVMTLLKHAPNVPERVREVYSVYRARHDAFAPARDALPPNLKILGVTTYDDPETSLWRPFGSRRIAHVCPQDSAADLKARGIEYVLVRNQLFGTWFPDSLDDWLKKMNAQVVWKIPLNLRAAQGPMDWYLVKLN